VTTTLNVYAGEIDRARNAERTGSIPVRSMADRSPASAAPKP